MIRRAVLIAGLLAGTWGALRAQDFHVADSIVESGIRQGIYPGAVLIVGRKSGVLHQRGYGHLTWRGTAPVPSPESTLWDLASLTKVVGTTGAIMHLVQQRRIDLDAPVAHYLPRFTGGARDRVTVRMLLDHTSGLPSYVELFKLAATRDSAISLLYATPLRRPPGSAAEYSDLNFLLLGLMVEQVSGEPLDRFVQQNVLDPAGMQHSRYRPGASAASHTAPTGQWGGRPVCCVVNDQNAVRMGGAAGHAGLFSTGGDLARYARLWLNLGTLDGRTVFDSATARGFLLTDRDSATPRADATRLLGWERPPPAPVPVMRVVAQAPPRLCTRIPAREIASRPAPPIPHMAACSPPAPTATPAGPARCSGSIPGEISFSFCLPIGATVPGSATRSGPFEPFGGPWPMQWFERPTDPRTHTSVPCSPFPSPPATFPSWKQPFRPLRPSGRPFVG